MTRGGRTKHRDGPERRCIATGDSGPTDRLVRFVLAPEGGVVPDLAGRLPGRGAWLTADRALVEMAVRKGLFSRAFRQKVSVPPDLADQLEALLASRMVQTISLARKAGQAVTGAEKVRAHITGGHADVLLQAHDGAPDGRAKLSAVAAAVGNGRISEVNLLSKAELGLAFGRDFAIHAALDAGGFAARVCAEATRLSGLRTELRPDGTIDDEPRRGLTGTDPAARGNDERQGADGGARE